MLEKIEPLTDQSITNNVYLLSQTNNLRAMHSIIRHKHASRHDFVHYANRINRLLMEEAFNHLPFESEEVPTPVGATYKGLRITSEVCGVSIIRAGESMESELRLMCPSIRIGKILLQRDKITKLPHWFYTSLPENISNKYVLLMEPMLATGGSASAAIEILTKNGVSSEKIILITFLATLKGIAAVRMKSAKIKIITSSIEEGLTKEAFMIPGIGDFGDRYFGTDCYHPPNKQP